jgi:CRP/FNR family cyclic AMP-dependent transcriptional regulator
MPRFSYKQGDVFSGLSDPDMDEICRKATLRAFERGTFLYLQGEHSSSLFLVRRGMIRTFYTGLDGDEFTFGFWEVGDLVGAPDLSGHGTTRRALSAQAVARVEVLELAPNLVEELCLKFPVFALNLVHALSFKVRWVSMIAGNLSTKKVARRLMELLKILANMYGVPSDDSRVILGRRFTEYHLAMMLGCSRQWLSIQLRKFRTLGIVSGVPSQGLVIDLEALAVAEEEMR